MTTHHTDSLALDNPLWRDALHLYERKGMKKALLDLQAQGFSVNGLLTMLWLSEHGLLVNATFCQKLIALSKQSLIAQFRTVRTAIKTDQHFQDLYQAFLSLELKLEQREIALYYSAIKDSHDLMKAKGSLIALNLECYAKALNLKPKDSFSALRASISSDA